MAALLRSALLRLTTPLGAVGNSEPGKPAEYGP
jgi:hypothetical protein